MTADRPTQAIDPKTLSPGTVIRHKSGSDTITLAHRKPDDTGWWMTDGSGLVDWAWESGDWIVVSRPEQELLTEEELKAMDLLATLAGKLRRIIGNGPCAEGDWREAAYRIHGLQTLVMAQAASRAYPERFRLLGGSDA